MKYLAAFIVTFSMPGIANAAEPDGASNYIFHDLHVSNYKRADADFNRDGRPEVLVYVREDDYCGSGGCTLFVLTEHRQRYRVVLRATIAQLPIKLLAGSSHGWSDLGITVAGGGITHSYMARLRFNGRHYPNNPTIPPATPLANPVGQVLIR